MTEQVSSAEDADAYQAPSTASENRVREVAERVAADYGLELVHVETARSGGSGDAVLRIFIDKPEGVTHEDCAKVSQHVSVVLDAEDFMRGNYVLEVSSPGLERGLYKQADYERFAGSLAQVRTSKPIGNQRNFRGRILGLDGENVNFDDRTSKQISIPFALIQKANLEIDTEAEFRFAQERSRQTAEQTGGDE